MIAASARVCAVLIAFAVGGCSASATCPSGAKLESGKCVKTVVETRVECPKGSHFQGDHCVAEELKVAKVDFGVAVVETFEAKAAAERLQIVYERHQHDLDQKQEELKKDKDEIEKMPPSPVRDQRAAAWQEKANALQRTFVEYQKDLADQQTAAIKEVMERKKPKLVELAIEAARAEGFAALFEQCATVLPEGVRCDGKTPLWVRSGVDARQIEDQSRWDLTPTVIARYQADLANK